MKQNRYGSERANRQEGIQTLKAEHSGLVMPANRGSPRPHVLKGTEAQERSRLAAAGRLGFAEQDSREGRNSMRGRD